MAVWRRCDRCRKVLTERDFDGDALICTGCLAVPVRKVRAARAAAVTTRRVATAEPAPAPDPAASGVHGPPTAGSGATPAASAPQRPARQGVVGRGDPEVRGRRARTRALQQLSEMHAGDFERLLLDARKAEGLT